MNRSNELIDVETLEKELKKQHFRYRLAIKDGALSSIVAEVASMISDLEEKIQKLKRETEALIPFGQDLVQGKSIKIA